MGGASYITHMWLVSTLGNTIATLAAIFIGVIVYALMIAITGTLSKEEIYMIPFGTKLYNVLLKLKIYKEGENQ